MESKVILVIYKFNSFINHQHVLFFYYTIITLIIDILYTEMKFDEQEEVTLTTKINRNDDPKSPRAISINIP